jgi:hypothetical protein
MAMRDSDEAERVAHTISDPVIEAETLREIARILAEEGLGRFPRTRQKS